MEFSYYSYIHLGPWLKFVIRNTEVFQCKSTEVQSGQLYCTRISEVSAIERCLLGEVPLYFVTLQIHLDVLI